MADSSPSFAVGDCDDLLLYCHIQPRASRDAIVGLYQGRLKVQVTSPPVDGRANGQLIIFMAKSLGVSKSRVHLEKGENSRQKVLRIKAMSKLPESFPFQP